MLPRLKEAAESREQRAESREQHELENLILQIRAY
jgi:hypothetical protein